MPHGSFGVASKLRRLIEASGASQKERRRAEASIPHGSFDGSSKLRRAIEASVSRLRCRFPPSLPLHRSGQLPKLAPPHSCTKRGSLSSMSSNSSSEQIPFPPGKNLTPTIH